MGRARSWFGYAVALPLFARLVACGSDSADEPDASLDGGDEASAEAGTDDASDKGPSRGSGQVIGFTGVPLVDGGPGSRSANAYFHWTTSSPSETDCTRVTEGECFATQCPTGQTAVPVVDSGPPPVVGTISLSGGGFGSGFELVPDDAGGFSSKADQTQAAFTGGETIVFSFPGAPSVEQGPPPFRFEAIAPFIADLSEPAFLGGSGVVSRANDLVVAWTLAGPVPPEAGLSMTMQADGEDTRTTIGCTFDPAAKSGTISKALLAHMPVGKGIVNFSIRANWIASRAEGWTVIVQLAGTATAHGRTTRATGNITFE